MVNLVDKAKVLLIDKANDLYDMRREELDFDNTGITIGQINYAMPCHQNNNECSNVFLVRNLVLGTHISRGRNQKPFNGEIDYDYILWIDCDTVWSVENLENLFNTDGDIVSGLYLMQDKQNFSAVEVWDEAYFKQNYGFKYINISDIQNYKEPFEVSYAGMGFMLVKKGVFEALQYPYFEALPFDFGDGIFEYTSEDIGFCLKAKKQGFNVIVNPNIIVGHEKMIIL